jgi:choline kinase
MSAREMKGIILAAGRGKRMGSMTDHQPKCLAEINGRPLLEWQLEAFEETGIHDVAIVTGYKRDLLSNYKFNEFFNCSWATTNMVYSLNTAADWLAGDDCLVSYSDIFYEPAALKSLQDCTEDLAITYDPNWAHIWRARFQNPLVDAETFKIDQNQKVLEIGKTPKKIDDIDGQYMGLLKFSRGTWGSLVNGLERYNNDLITTIDMTTLLQFAIEKTQISLSGVPYLGLWGEVDTCSDLELYNRNYV